jgi:hypothetical protein
MTVSPKGNKSRISFASAVRQPHHLTKAAMLHQQAAKDLSKQMQTVQGHTPVGRPCPNVARHPVAPNTTEVTVICFGGMDDATMEGVLRKHHAVDLVCDLQKRFALAVTHPPKILSGRWAITDGNFILTFAGELAASVIFSYCHIVRPLFSEFVELCPV